MSMLTSVFSCSQDCAGVILYAAENATQVALDAIQILGKCYVCNCSISSSTLFDKHLLHVTCYILLTARERLEPFIVERQDFPTVS